jgi:hypothetical protein
VTVTTSIETPTACVAKETKTMSFKKVGKHKGEGDEAALTDYAVAAKAYAEQEEKKQEDKKKK